MARRTSTPSWVPARSGREWSGPGPCEAGSLGAARVLAYLTRHRARPGDIAAAMGVSGSTIRGWLRGDRSPSAIRREQIRELCAVRAGDWDEGAP